MTNKEMLIAKSQTKKIKKYEWLLSTYRELNRPTRIESIDNVESFYTKYYNTNTPFIRHNYISFNISIMDLKKFINNIEVEISANRDKYVDYERIKNKLISKMLFHDYLTLIDQTEESNALYLIAYNQNKDIFDSFYSLLPKIPILSNQQGFVWLGPKGTITPWHFDLTNNLLLQVIGSKEVLLIPSWDLPLINNNQHVFSDTHYRDVIENPTINQPEIIKIILNAGDLLFIPVGWSHYIRSLDKSMTITYTDFHRENDFSKSFI